MPRFALHFLLSFLLLLSACQDIRESTTPREAEVAFDAQEVMGPAPAVPVALESDGLQLSGRFFPAEGSGLNPTFLLLPGWPGNPEDVLGLGARLRGSGINVLMVTPRGMHESEGTTTFAGALKDIGASLQWLGSDSVAEVFQIDRTDIILGGYSWGGGMAMAYAASDPDVRKVISIAGTDHGEFIRELNRNEAMAAGIRAMLSSTRAPEGPIRFDVESVLREMAEGQNVFGLVENAVRLSDRRILLIGGWEDSNNTVEQVLLPLYRALRAAGAEDVTLQVYHDDHGFGQVRQQIAVDIAAWVTGRRDR